MSRTVCVIGGDGIGPEVIGAALRVLDELDCDIDYLHAEAGLACHARTGTYLPEATLAAVREADAVFFGAITSPLAAEDPDYKSVILQLRQEMDAYANVRPARDLGQPCKAPGLDLVLVRENSEGLYNAQEVVDDFGVTTLRRITKKASTRVNRFAFELALQQERKKVVCAHKANVLRQSDGLFRRSFLDVAAQYPELAHGEILLDNLALQLILNPARFDVLVTMNLYGDVISDEMAGLVGGLGFAPSGSYGETKALFEPVHGSAPDIAGKGLANPCGAILSAGMMLTHLGIQADAARIEAGVRGALQQGRTRDVGGDLGTEAFTDLVITSLP